MKIHPKQRMLKNRIIQWLAVFAIIILCGCIGEGDMQQAKASDGTVGDSRDDVVCKEYGDYYMELNLIGLFSIDSWYAGIEIPITSDYVIPRVEESMNVRQGPSTDTEVIGIFRAKSYAKILERGEEWTKIESGNVVGYVNNNYLYMDEEVVELFDEWNAFQVSITAQEMNVRCEPNTECEIIGTAKNGEIYTWYPEQSSEEWFAIQYDEDTVAYVSSTYSDSVTNLGTALTLAEEKIRFREEQYAIVLERSLANPPPRTVREPMSFTEEEMELFAAVIAMEALDEPYDGKVAVANVIINRILDGYWGDTLHEVIYAPGQFTGANSGRVEVYRKLISESCIRAAEEAAAGNNNIDDYLFFISLPKAEYDKFTKCYVLGGHCFYARNW